MVMQVRLEGDYVHERARVHIGSDYWKGVSRMAHFVITSDGHVQVFFAGPLHVPQATCSHIVVNCVSKTAYLHARVASLRSHVPCSIWSMMPKVCGAFNWAAKPYSFLGLTVPWLFPQACQRYWTAGGTLRNVPVGAGRRKHKNAAARMQARLPPQSSAQTHVSPSTLESFRVAELLQHQHGLPTALPPTLHHHGLMPAVGVGVGLALPHLAPATLAGGVFVPDTGLPAHGLSSQQISRPGSSINRSSDTLQHRLTSSNLNSKSVPSKPNGNGNGNSSSGRSSDQNAKGPSEEGSVHNRRYPSNRTTVRNKGSGEHGTNGESSGPQEPHNHLKSNGGGSASDPVRATTASPSPPAAPSNGTLSHDSGTLLQGPYPTFAFPGQQHCDPGYGGRDAASTAWHLSLPHQHQHLALANLQAQATMAAATLGPSPYGLPTPWPAYGVYPPAPFGNQQYAAAMYARCAGLPTGQIPLPFQASPPSSSANSAGPGSDFAFHSPSVSALLPQLSHQRDRGAASRPFSLPGAWAQTRPTWALDLLQPSGVMPVLPRSDRRVHMPRGGLLYFASLLVCVGEMCGARESGFS